MKFTEDQKIRINRIYEQAVLKEISGVDYILYNAIKKVFKLRSFNFGEYLIIKNSVEKIIKEKRIS